MSAVPAARYLADFGAGGESPVAPLARNKTPINEAAEAAARLDEAFARGVDAGRSAADAEFEARLAEHHAESEARLAAEREQWVTVTGEDLANRLQTAVQEFEMRVAETTARVLKPFLAAEIHRQAIAELQANLGALLTTDAGANLSISGPADVLENLRQHLADRAINATFTPADTCDVRIVAGAATLETQLKSWMARLEEATR